MSKKEKYEDSNVINWGSAGRVWGHYSIMRNVQALQKPLFEWRQKIRNCNGKRLLTSSVIIERFWNASVQDTYLKGG